MEIYLNLFKNSQSNHPSSIKFKQFNHTTTRTTKTKTLRQSLSQNITHDNLSKSELNKKKKKIMNKMVTLGLMASNNRTTWTLYNFTKLL